MQSCHQATENVIFERSTGAHGVIVRVRRIFSRLSSRRQGYVVANQRTRMCIAGLERVEIEVVIRGRAEVRAL